MRRICIAAILAATLPVSVFAQSLRPSYAPDGVSQAARSIAAKRIARAQRAEAKTARPREPVENAAAAQSYAAPAAGAAAQNHSLQDFFATLFAGPSMLANAFRPAQSQYTAMP